MTNYPSKRTYSKRQNNYIKEGRKLVHKLKPLQTRETIAKILGMTRAGIAYTEINALCKIAKALKEDAALCKILRSDLNINSL